MSLLWARLYVHRAGCGWHRGIGQAIHDAGASCHDSIFSVMPIRNSHRSAIPESGPQKNVTITVFRPLNPILNIPLHRSLWIP